jgi:hypothetical protein
MTAEEKIGEVLDSWLRPGDGGYGGDYRFVRDKVIVARVSSYGKPEGIAIYRQADVASVYDKAEALGWTMDEGGLHGAILETWDVAEVDL